MRGVACAIGLLASLASANLAVAQQPPQLGGEVGGKPKIPEGMSAAGAYGPSMGLLAQKSKGGGAPPSGDAAYPMFQLLGPEMRSSFWADPKEAGRTLVLITPPPA